MCSVVCALLIQIQMIAQMKRVHSCTTIWMGDLVWMEKYTSGVEFKVRSLGQLLLNLLVALVLKSWP